MFTNKEKKIKRLIIEVLNDHPEFITDHMETLIDDPKKIKKFEKSLDIARAQRIRKEFEHLVEELEDEEIEMEKSTTPWYNLAVCQAYDEDRGWPMKVFCNSAFLREIEKQGIPRGPKDQMLHQWLDAVRGYE